MSSTKRTQFPEREQAVVRVEGEQDEASEQARREFAAAELVREHG